MIKSTKDDHIKQLKAQIKELSSRQGADLKDKNDTAVIIGTKNVEISSLKSQISELKERMEKEKKELTNQTKGGLYEDKIEYYVLWIIDQS